MNAILVIDMLRGFCEEGFPLYCGDEVRKIIPKIQKLLEDELRKGAKIFFICDSHEPEDAEFQMFPPHCVKGTVEAEIIPELSEYPGEVIPKTRFSGFYKTELEEKLNALRPEKLVICGVCTDICVLYTVADARFRNFKVEVVRDCVLGTSPQAHEFALRHMERVLGAKISTLEERSG